MDVRSIVRSSCNRRFTGRSTNGRSRDFESLCLGSNPSRPTTKSTPGANRKNLGLFRGNNLPQRYDVLDSARNSAEKEVRSLKGRSLLLLRIRNKGFTRRTAPQQGSAR